MAEEVKVVRHETKGRDCKHEQIVEVRVFFECLEKKSFNSLRFYFSPTNLECICDTVQKSKC